MRNHLIINDVVSFNLMQQDLTKIQDNMVAAALAQPGKGLVAEFAATHSGIITRNNGFYLPDRMKAGVHTFTENYQKPVLRQHDQSKDPIGRIIEASYVDTSGVVKDRFKSGFPIKNSAGKEIGVINDALISDFTSGKMPYGTQVDVVRNMFSKALLDDTAYEGLGFIKIKANITDPDAIQKFLDGRYLTGSIGAKTDRAICSVCKEDWADVGPCSHKPGAIYDEAKCFIIAGNLEYSEYSTANVPADRHSKALTLYYNGTQQNIEIANTSARVPEILLGLTSMEDKVKIQDPKQLQDSATAVVTTDEAPQAPETTTVSTPEPESFENLVTRILALKDEVISDKDEETVYQLMLDEMKALGLTDQEITDAQLSTEKRKSLAASTFCGPGRSFPVPDCAHVTAARRLIGRYTGPGDKTSILACVSRKAKAMGCSTSDSVEVKDNMQRARIMHQLLTVIEENNYVPMDSDPALSEEDLNSVRNMLKRLASLVGKDALVKAAGLEKISADAALLDEVVALEETIGTLRDQIDELQDTNKALKEEYEAVYKDMNVMQDSIVAEKVKTRKAKENLVTVLSDIKEKKKGSIASFTDLSDQLLDAEVEKLSKDVDMDKVLDKLSDGMARTPSTISVENPGVVLQETKQILLTDAQEKEYRRIYMKVGPAAGEAFKTMLLQKDSK